MSDGLSLWGPPGALGVACLLLVGVLEMAGPTPAGEPVAAVFSPGLSADQTMAAILRTDARLVGGAWFDNIVLVQSPDPGFPEALRDAGAIAVIGGAYFHGCVGAAPERMETVAATIQ